MHSMLYCSRLMCQKAQLCCGITCNLFFSLQFILLSELDSRWRFCICMKWKFFPCIWIWMWSRLEFLFFEGADIYKRRNWFGAKQHLLLWQPGFQCGRTYVVKCGRNNSLSKWYSTSVLMRKKWWWAHGESYSWYSNIKLFLLCMKTWSFLLWLACGILLLLTVAR